MASTFDKFDWPYGIRVYKNVASDGFAADGTAQVATVSTATITGHLTPYASRDSAENAIEQTSLGAIEQGMFRFFTEAVLTKGDILEVDQDSGGAVKFQYTIQARVRSHTLMAKYTGNPVRYEYLAKENPR